MPFVRTESRSDYSFVLSTYRYFDEKGCQKNCAVDNPKRWYGINISIRCSWHCRHRTCLSFFLLLSSQTYVLDLLCLSFKFPWNKNSKPPTIPLRIVAYTFSDNLPRNSYKPTELKFPTMLKNGRLVGLVPLFSTLNCSICSCYLHSLTYQGQQRVWVYVVVQFYHWFKFYFPLFLGMVMDDNEFETKENNI